jgi:multiple antibiotic resistance protein
MDMTLIFNFAAAMLSVVNPIGNLPIFITYTAGERKQVRTWLAVFIALTVFVLLTVFLVIGTGLLNFFGITIAAFRISGGILLLLTGIAMVRGGQAKHHDELVAKGKQTDLKEAEFVYGKILVPLGIPLFVGPGSISTVILYSSQIQNPATQLGLIGVLGAIALAVLFTLLSSAFLQRLLGNMGMEVATRLLGMILTAIGIQFILNGLANATIGLINPVVAR